MLEEVPNNTQVFNFGLIDNIKDPYNNKAYEKSCLVIHTQNNEKKNLMLIYSPKIPEVSQDIGSCLATIIQ